MGPLGTSEIVIIVFVLAVFVGAITFLIRFGQKKLADRSPDTARALHQYRDPRTARKRTTNRRRIPHEHRRVQHATEACNAYTW